jgi:uncharacterized protein (TIGR00251 family)
MLELGIRSDGMKIALRVVPGSGAFRIVRAEDGTLKVFLKSRAEDNKANIELIKEMSRLLGSRVSIVSGAKSRKKVIEADISEKELENIISSFGR